MGNGLPHAALNASSVFLAGKREEIVESQLQIQNHQLNQPDVSYLQTSCVMAS
jgi:hypothetical protein